jgi:excisionase family DNA binding protein
MYFVEPVSYDTITTYIFGMDQGASGALLTGFHEFLLLRLGEQDNLAWPGLVLRLAHGGDRPTPLSKEDEVIAIDYLFDLLDEFLAEIRDAHELRRLFHEYFFWAQTQPGYNADLIRFMSSPPTAVLTVDEAAETLAVTRRAVFDLIADYKLMALRSGATVLVRASDVAKLAQS